MKNGDVDGFVGWNPDRIICFHIICNLRDLATSLGNS